MTPEQKQLYDEVCRLTGGGTQARQAKAPTLLTDTEQIEERAAKGVLDNAGSPEPAKKAATVTLEKLRGVESGRAQAILNKPSGQLTAEDQKWLAGAISECLGGM